jgi:hypothetical protein
MRTGPLGGGLFAFGLEAEVDAKDVPVGLPEIQTSSTFEARTPVPCRRLCAPHDDDRELYASTKRKHSGKVWPTTQDYADAKSTVIEASIQRALGGAPPSR